MSHIIGFIGGGNMGRSIMTALLKKELYTPEEIVVYDSYTPVLDHLHESLGVRPCRDIEKVAELSDILLLAVKPQVMPDVLAELNGKIRPEVIVVSIAAGVTIKQLEDGIGADKKIVRVMPNTAALVGEAMSGVVVNPNIDYDEKKIVINLFKALGRAELISEKLIDAVVGISGSSPAYVYMFIEALAAGAVAEGMPKNQAYIFAAQAVLGSAKMVLASGYHPGELIDMVCSPGGTTIEAVEVLEHKAFKATVTDAVRAAAAKNRELQ